MFQIEYRRHFILRHDDRKVSTLSTNKRFPTAMQALHLVALWDTFLTKRWRRLKNTDSVSAILTLALLSRMPMGAHLSDVFACHEAIFSLFVEKHVGGRPGCVPGTPKQARARNFPIF
jgi:hypothetical protein